MFDLEALLDSLLQGFGSVRLRTTPTPLATTNPGTEHDRQLSATGLFNYPKSNAARHNQNKRSHTGDDGTEDGPSKLQFFHHSDVGLRYTQQPVYDLPTLLFTRTTQRTWNNKPYDLGFVDLKNVTTDRKLFMALREQLIMNSWWKRLGFRTISGVYFNKVSPDIDWIN